MERANRGATRYGGINSVGLPIVPAKEDLLQRIDESEPAVRKPPVHPASETYWSNKAVAAALAIEAETAALFFQHPVLFEDDLTIGDPTGDLVERFGNEQQG